MQLVWAVQNTSPGRTLCEQLAWSSWSRRCEDPSPQATRNTTKHICSCSALNSCRNANGRSSLQRQSFQKSGGGNRWHHWSPCCSWHTHRQGNSPASETLHSKRQRSHTSELSWSTSALVELHCLDNGPAGRSERSSASQGPVNWLVLAAAPPVHYDARTPCSRQPTACRNVAQHQLGSGELHVLEAVHPFPPGSDLRSCKCRYCSADSASKDPSQVWQQQ